MSVPRRTRAARRGAERLRRNPRADRDSLEEAEHVETAARVRRDPRTQRTAGSRGLGDRMRIDRARPMTVVDASSAAPLQDALCVLRVVIENPACWILAVPDLEDRHLSHRDREALGAARHLADAHAGAVIALAFPSSEDLGAAGADRVLKCESSEFEGYAPEARAAAVLAAIEHFQPRHVVFPDSAGGGDIGRRVASKLGELAATHVQRIDAQEAISRGDGGRTDYVRGQSRLILVDAGAAEPVTDALHEGRMLDAPDVRISSGITDLGLMSVDAESVPLAEAELIVAAGAGVTAWDSFHALARALGAAEGGTRVVCDAGCLPRARQIGASGTLVAPRCYLALGISGAPQHLQGIAQAERVIAVNTDPHAELIKRADLAVVGNVQQVMAALLRQLGQDKRDA